MHPIEIGFAFVDGKGVLLSGCSAVGKRVNFISANEKHLPN